MSKASEFSCKIKLAKQALHCVDKTDRPRFALGDVYMSAPVLGVSDDGQLELGLNLSGVNSDGSAVELRRHTVSLAIDNVEDLIAWLRDTFLEKA